MTDKQPFAGCAIPQPWTGTPDHPTLDSIAATIPQARRPGGVCTIARIRGHLTPDALPSFEAKLADPHEWPDLRMAWLLDGMVMAKMLPPGLNCSKDTINRHRNGGCQCPRLTR